MSLWQILADHSFALFSGLLTTCKLCLIVWSASFIFGGLVGVAAAQDTTIRTLTHWVSAILSGVPAIVVLYWAYYPGQALLGIDLEPFPTACIALSLLGTFMISEAVFHAIEGLPDQYVTAAKVCGLSELETLRKIVVPIVLSAFIPNALMILVTLFHMTLFASFISVEEVFRVAQRINSVIYRPIEIYTALAIFCLSVSLPLYGFAAWLRGRNLQLLSET